MKSIYENVSENETTVPIICSELNFNKNLVGKIIKRLGLIELRKEFINNGMTKVYSKYPLYSECERYSKLSYAERLNEGWVRNFGNLENFYTIRSKHTKDTNLKKYGVENVFQSEQIKEKIKQINIEKYGTENPMQNEQIKNKSMETQKERYGKIAFIDSYKCKKYKCGDVYFDSQWEIYMYYYLLKNNINFKYQHKFKYKDLNGKEHTYKCDFYLIDSNEFIEIKNPSFLTEDGKLRTIYKKGLTKKTIRRKKHDRRL